ncbi:hypothetical protein GCM10023189_16970 [Nibrella saemangeumensis]|uniref:Uncharacterized protein n=1 Tax=Nibrella saemangeumensis TaxID=1084526 RepID=A0ABP8MQM6_9BACT
MKRKGLRLVYNLCLAVLVLLFIAVAFASLKDRDYGVGVIACLLFLVGYWLIDKYGGRMMRSSWFHRQRKRPQTDK